MSDQDGNKPNVIHTKGLVITLDQSLESSEWPKINYLMRKGYSREEAIALLPKLAYGEIHNIDDIPAKGSLYIGKDVKES
jgi:hypothetical protein